METIVLLILVPVLGYCWYQAWEQNKVYKEQVRSLSFQVQNLQSQVKGAEHKLQLASGEYQERERKIYGDVANAADDLTNVLNMFPYIEDVNSLMARMSPEDMRALDLPWGHEYQVGMTQIAAQKGEALARLHEFGLKFALFTHYLRMTGAVLAPGTRFLGDLLEQQHELLKVYAQKIRLPGFKQQLAKAMAVNAVRLEKAYLHGEEQPSEQMVSLFLQAIDQVCAELPDGEVQEAREPVVVSGQVVEKQATASEAAISGRGSRSDFLDSVLKSFDEDAEVQADNWLDDILFPEEYEEYYGKRSANGSGKANNSGKKAGE